MDNTIKCLDHGFVKLLNLSGPTRRVYEDYEQGSPEIGFWHETVEKPFDASDRDPAQTARISFNNKDADRSEEEDYKLYEYLIKHKHSTPIEMIETWWEMKLPIFVERQFVRHRMQTINEVSARYSTLPAEWYIPKIVGGKSKSNKQGQEDNIDLDIQEWFKQTLDNRCSMCYIDYKEALANGIAPEHARLFLHVNHYTHLIRKFDLHNLMHFLSLRLDKHAQVEARVYAQAMFDLLERYLPKSMELFKKYRMVQE
jgi:thymidylate synthase (FAD)